MFLLFFMPFFGCQTETETETNFQNNVSISSPTSFSAADITMAIEEASWGLLSIDPILHHDAWVYSMQQYSSASCPPMEEHNGMDLWRESCTTEDGNQFLGWTLHFLAPYFDSQQNIFTDYRWLSGQAQIINSDGITLQNFGDILFQEERIQNHHRAFYGFVYGDFGWTSEQAVDSWLQSTISTEYYYNFVEDNQMKIIDIQAWVSGFSPDYSAAIFDDIHINQNICDEEPSFGSIWVRNNSGFWVEVLYDGEENCDGCGIFTQEDQTETIICADFSMWLNWEEYPWEER